MWQDHFVKVCIIENKCLMNYIHKCDFTLAAPKSEWWSGKRRLFYHYFDIMEVDLLLMVKQKVHTMIFEMFHE